MAASKALLASSLTVTFLSGAFVGHVSAPGGSPAPLRESVETIYYEQFQDLRAAGYDDAELDRARHIYGDYLKAYRRWWDQVLESMPDTVGAIDDRLHAQLRELELDVKERRGETVPDEVREADGPGK